jgi:hypothetical protein
MQYESAKSQPQSPPNNVSLKGMAFEAAGCRCWFTFFSG